MKRIFLTSLAFFAIVAFSCDNSFADQVLASAVTVDRLAQDSNLVVRVKINEVEQHPSQSQRRAISSVKAEVLEVVKGNAKVGDNIRFISDRKVIKDGESVVFLTGGANGVYSVAGLTFGVYDIKLTKENKQNVILGSSRRDTFRGLSTRVPNLSKSMSGKEAAAINSNQREIPVEDFTSILRQIVKEQETSESQNRSTK